MTLLAIAQELDMAEVVWTLRLDDYAPAAVPQILDQAAKAKDDDILFSMTGIKPQ